MVTSGGEAVERIRKAPINHGLIKLIQHELGNGLAVLSGYRQLLQRAISAPSQAASPLTQDGYRDRDERWSGYLRTMQDRETRLNRLLVQLRELSPETIDEPLCQNMVQTDLVVLLRQVIEQRIPLCSEYPLQVSMPAQPLFVRCDPFWMQVLFEHVFFNHMIVRQTTIMSAEIHLESFPASRGQEAKITLRILSELPELVPARAGEFETRIRGLEQEEVEACLALCHQILHEHGGQIWDEQERGISLTLPLAGSGKDFR